MILKKYGDLLVGIFFLILAAALYLSAAALPPSLMGGIGADFMPRILAIGTGLLAILQILAGVKTMGSYTPAQETSVEDQPEYLRVLATIVSFTVYVFVLQTIGFLVSSMVYLFVQMIILAPKEKRNPVLFAVISAVFNIAVYFIFRSGLNVMLPAGILG